MQADFYAQQLELITALEPSARHAAFSALHIHLCQDYCQVVGSMQAEQAARPSSDGRSLALVVGHIAEWDRYLILACGEMLAGVQLPQIMRLSGYLEPDGAPHDFNNVDDFNAFQAQRQAGFSWEEIQATALQSAQTLLNLFTQPGLLNAERLEQTMPAPWRLSAQKTILLPVGWQLWGINMEHEGVEHAPDLGLG